MTALSTTPDAGHLTAPSADRRGAGFARLTAVELRKSVDTRASQWLLVTVLALTAAACAVQLGVAAPQERTFTTLLTVAQVPASILVPVVAILAVTGESSTRSILLTATLVPDRVRLGLAKLAAVMVLVLAVTAAVAVLAAAATAVGVAIGGPARPWAVEPALLGGVALSQVLLGLVGVGLGLLLVSSPLAIVTYFVLPTVLTALGALVQRLAEPLSWVDLNAALAPLTLADPAAMSGGQWGRLAVSTAVWGLLPLVVGLVRLRRRDIA